MGDAELTDATFLRLAADVADETTEGVGARLRQIADRLEHLERQNMLLQAALDGAHV